MRMFMKVSIPVEAGNAASRSNTLATTIQTLLTPLKPEAAYFTEEKGLRTALIFFDMTDSSMIPAIAEPWFLAFNAAVSIRPAMNAQDLAKGVSGVSAVSGAQWDVQQNTKS